MSIYHMLFTEIFNKIESERSIDLIDNVNIR